MLAYSLGAQSPSAHRRNTTKPTFPLRSRDSCSVSPHYNMSPGLSVPLGWTTAAMMGQTRSYCPLDPGKDYMEVRTMRA